MFLEYMGKKENLTLKMPWFVSGPYFIEGPGDVFEVSDADGPELAKRNEKMLKIVPAPVVEEKVTEPVPQEDKPAEETEESTRIPCSHPGCKATYANEANLAVHIKAMHKT